MNKRLPSILAAFLLPVAAFGADSTPDPGPAAVTGTFVLIEHVKGVEAADRIAFHPDGSCVLDLDGRKGLTGSYNADADGNLSLVADGGKTALSYHFKRGKVGLVLSHDGDDDLYYGLLPDYPPRLQFSDLVGSFSCDDENGDSVTTITPDHKFSVHLRQLTTVAAAPSGIVSTIASWFNGGANKVYYDIAIDGTCSYADGVTTYIVEHYAGSQPPDQSLSDVVIKRDDKGLWIIDPYHDKVICQPPAANLDLPAPPAGYDKATP
jgi:hypothetical protein